MHETRPPLPSTPPPTRSGLPTRRKALRLVAAAPWLLLVAACGQKGPLYYPPEPDEEAPGAESPGEDGGDEALGEEDGEDEDGQTSAAPPAPGARLA